MRLPSIALALLFALACLQAQAAPKKIALLVGVSDYISGTSPRDAFIKLETRPDVDSMKRILEASWNFDSVKVLFDEQATQAAIRREFRTELIDRAQPGDSVVFYFTGHGFFIPNQPNDDLEIDGLDEALVTWVPRDSQNVADEPRRDLMFMRDDVLRSLINDLAHRMKSKATGKVIGSITVIVDSCHSGTAAKGWSDRKGREWNVAIDGPRPPQTSQLLASIGHAFSWDQGSESPVGWDGGGLPDGAVFMAASESDEPAVMMPDQKRHGSVFTYHLARTLENSRSMTSVTNRELFNAVRCSVLGQRNSQSPQAEGNMDSLLFGDGSPRKPLDFVRVERVQTPERIELATGEIEGATVGSVYSLIPLGKDLDDPRQSIGEATIIRIEPFKAFADVVATKPGLKVEDLEQSRAVLKEFAPPITKMKVHAAEGHPSIPLLRSLVFVDLIIGDKPPKDALLSFSKKSEAYEALRNQVTASEPLRAINEEQLSNLILAEWRLSNLMNLRTATDSNNLELGIAFVKDASIYEFGQSLPKSDVLPNPNRQSEAVVLVPNDQAVIVGRLKQGAPRFISIVYPKIDGSVDALSSDEKFPSDGTWRILGVFGEVGAPWGSEVIKVFATQEKLDLSQMARPKAERTNLNAKGSESELLELLFTFQDGAKTTGLSLGKGRGSWSTSSISITTKPRR